jgi:predicted phage-related endonuclease
MWKKLGLAVAISVMAAAPAWAESACGGEPIPPEIPSAAELGQKSPADALKTKHQAFADITTWQKSALKDFRSCLDADENSQKRELQTAQSQAKPDDDRIKRIKDQIAGDEKATAHSIDTEEHLVNDFHALSTAYCSRSDVDKASCPKA